MRNSKVIPFGPFTYSLRGPFCICTILMVLIVATSLVVFNRSATSNPTFADNVSSLFAGMPQISQSISSNAAMPKINTCFTSPSNVFSGSLQVTKKRYVSCYVLLKELLSNSSNSKLCDSNWALLDNSGSCNPLIYTATRWRNFTINNYKLRNSRRF